jgi:acyl-CoA reductase-like NAD-dependent aldehyde dehydrogenase
MERIHGDWMPTGTDQRRLRSALTVADLNGKSTHQESQMASSSITRIAPEHDETARLQAGAAFAAEGPVTLATRINRLIRLTADNGSAIVEALRADFGGARSAHGTMLTEILSKVLGMEYARDHLAAWMKPESRQTNAPFDSLGATSEVVFQPKGVVGIISPWNMAFGLAVAPLTSVLAAGNRAMIKPSEFRPQTSGLFVEPFGRYFDESEVAVIVGGADVGAAFARLPLDHLIFTGSTRVGRHIMRAAASPSTMSLLHYAQEDLPFGGIGPSGMGAYHGRDGFLTFSHARPVFRQGEQATHGALRPPFSPELLQHFQSELRQRATQKPVPN